MTTKREIVRQAYEEIGLGDYVFDMSPEMQQAALVRLDRLAAQWDATGLRFGFVLGGTLATESGLPDTSIGAYALNLALSIAPTIGKMVSQETRIAAREAKNALMITNYVIPQVQYPQMMPVGRGNQRAVKDNPYFNPPDPLTTGQDGELTL